MGAFAFYNLKEMKSYSSIKNSKKGVIMLALGLICINSD